MVALESAELFRHLRPEELQALRLVARERQFAAGEEIFREGAPGDGVYVVKQGRVEISGLMNDQTRRVFAHVEPGAMFGEMAVIELRPRSASARAASDAVVYYIPRGELLTLIGRSPGLGLSLLQQISHRLREFNRLFLDEVVQAERLAVVGRFARAIVHDLKNPLSIIGLTAEMACLPGAPPETRQIAHDRIRKQIERINELIGEILDFTQGARAGGALEPTDYAAFAREVLEEVRQETDLKGVSLEIIGAPPAVPLLVDPRRLRRVFFNLAHNATDAMAEGGRIFVRFRREPREVVTEIEDTGPGIPPEIAGKLFQAFATHGKEHGTGLGLSICKKIVEDHGGRIWARTEPGRGAIFSFSLPQAKPMPARP